MTKPKPKPKKKPTALPAHFISANEAIKIVAMHHAADSPSRRFYTALLLAVPHLTQAEMQAIEPILLRSIGFAMLETRLTQLGAPDRLDKVA